MKPFLTLISLLFLVACSTTTSKNKFTCAQGDCSNGTGRIVYANGGSYEGGFKNSEANGKGTSFHPNGDILEGLWEDDYLINGTFYYSNGDQYTGTLGGTVANQSNSAFGQARLWTGGDDKALAGADIAGGAQNADKRINIETRAAANDALTQLDRAITSASSERAMYGAYINRMEHTGNNLTNVARHQEQSRSRIADADYAVESTELSRTTIIAQASTAMLARGTRQYLSRSSSRTRTSGSTCSGCASSSCASW